MCAERNIHWKCKLNAVASETTLLAGVHCIRSKKKYKTSSFEWANEWITRREKQQKTINNFGKMDLPVFLSSILRISFSLFVCVWVCVCLQMSPHSTTIIHWKFSSIVQTSCRARVSSFIVLYHCSEFGLKTREKKWKPENQSEKSHGFFQPFW